VVGSSSAPSAGPAVPRAAPSSAAVPAPAGLDEPDPGRPSAAAATAAATGTAAVGLPPAPVVPGDPLPTAPAPGPVPTTAGPAPATSSTPQPPAEPAERTLSSAAGSVRATCPGAGTAQILSWAATKPYKVSQGDREAGPSPSVSFKHGARQLTMTVTCSDGVPSAANS